jgi:hypothetical protein
VSTFSGGVVPLDKGELKRGTKRMTRAIRTGQMDGKRLQKYHRERYSYESIPDRWIMALLDPQEFWGAADQPARSLQIGAKP